MSDEWPDFGDEFNDDISQLRAARDVTSKVTNDLAADIDHRKRKAEADNAELDVNLKKIIGRAALVLMGLQVVIADMAFFFYGFALEWDVPEAVIIGWMTATVVQVIGVVLIIARHLFPGQKP